MKRNSEQVQYAICVDNTDNPASLQLRKLYQVVGDSEAEALGQIRVIDEDGEDYLYSSDCFLVVNLQSSIIDAVNRTYELEMNR